MSRINGEKARAAIARKRRTAQRVKDRVGRQALLDAGPKPVAPPKPAKKKVEKKAETPEPVEAKPAKPARAAKKAKPAEENA